jgi:hypothetical protein
MLQIALEAVSSAGVVLSTAISTPGDFPNPDSTTKMEIRKSHVSRQPIGLFYKKHFLLMHVFPHYCS